MRKRVAEVLSIVRSIVQCGMHTVPAVGCLRRAAVAQHTVGCPRSPTSGNLVCYTATVRLAFVPRDQEAVPTQECPLQGPSVLSQN